MPKRNSDHYALIFGIRDYPAFRASKLEGPVDDAKDFRNWLVDPNGGNVPVKNVKCITSRQTIRNKGPNTPSAPTSATDARPAEYDIEREFRRFHDAVYRSKEKRLGSRIGKRLYIYFSGHGFAPERDESAICAANFSANETGSHVLAKRHAEWFANAGAFEEILLFTDSCRRSEQKIQSNWKSEALPPVPGTEPTRELYVYAAPYDQETREVLKNGARRGSFTLALLEGLRGAAADQDGNVTAESLQAYMETAIADLLDERDKSDPYVAKAPQVVKTAKGLLIAAPKRTKAGRAAMFKVCVHVPQALIGADVQVVDSNLKLMNQFQSSPEFFELPLKRGFYEIQVNSEGFSRSRAFEVTGAQEEMHLDVI